jgi:hypothetical protein
VIRCWVLHIHAGSSNHSALVKHVQAPLLTPVQRLHMQDGNALLLRSEVYPLTPCHWVPAMPQSSINTS